MRFNTLFFFFFVTFVASFDFDFNNDVSDDQSIAKTTATLLPTTSTTPATLLTTTNTTQTTTTTTQETTTTTTETTTTEKEAANETRREASTFDHATKGQSIGQEASSTTPEPLGREETSIDELTTTATATPEEQELDDGIHNLPNSNIERVKLEVVVTQSLYRIIDETMRERLVGFEARIASLLQEREEIRKDIDNFSPKTDDDFFSEAFKVKDRYTKFHIKINLKIILV